MYNRYIPNGAAYIRISEEDTPPFPPPSGPDARADTGVQPTSGADPAKKSGLAGLLHTLKLDSLDTGDILLLLIILFLFLEGDDMELMITLGLLLLLGLS